MSPFRANEYTYLFWVCLYSAATTCLYFQSAALYEGRRFSLSLLVLATGNVTNTLAVYYAIKTLKEAHRARQEEKAQSRGRCVESGPCERPDGDGRKCESCGFGYGHCGCGTPGCGYPRDHG